MHETDAKPDLAIVAFYSPEQVASIFGQFLQEDRTRKGYNGEGEVVVHPKGYPDTRWAYRHSSDKHGFLYRAARRHPGTRSLLFDRAEIDRIVAEFRPPPEIGLHQCGIVATIPNAGQPEEGRDGETGR